MIRSPALILLPLLSACVTSKVDVAECAGSADVDDTIAIVTDFKDSAHEMVTCGNITFQLIYALIDSAATFMQNPDSLPSAFTYEAGLYRASGTSVAMDLWLVVNDGSPLGGAGEMVEPNVFDPDSYFVGMSLADNGDGTATLSFDSPGPLAALLGQGAAPTSPLTVTDADAALLTSNLAALELSGLIYVDDARTVSTITYELSYPLETLTALIEGQRLDMEAVAATGVRDDLGQSLSTTGWDVIYGQLAGTLEGTIDADVVGGPFDFHANLSYDGISVEPVITITCL